MGDQDEQMSRPCPSGLAVAIKARRVACGYTQQQVADLAGNLVTKSYISMIESGAITDPGITKIQVVARVLRCPIGDLLRNTEEADELFDAVKVRDPAHRADGLLLLRYWDELSDDRKPTALGIIEMLAAEEARST